MPERLLIFDMDGVLAEVSESYREGIVRTVRHFTGRTVERGPIQEYKNLGGWNNDWALAQRLCRDLGVEVDYDRVVEHFLGIFLGADGSPGLILREEWIPRPGLLERLAASWRLGIFTGRRRVELAPTLRRFAAGIAFDPVLTADEVAPGKPSPAGLRIARERYPGSPVWYVGDTLDDARCARAAQAPFIGIAANANPQSAELAALLRTEGAAAVLNSVNEIEGALPR
jgi:HAD superfamily hydrolase (TIGR01548 family)